MHLLTMAPCPLIPGFDGALIHLKGRHYRLHWAAMRQQRHDLDELPFLLLDPIQGCPFAFAERFTTGCALIAFFNLAVDNDVARPFFSSVATAILSTKLFFGVHDTLWPQKATSACYLAPFCLDHVIVWCYPVLQTRERIFDRLGTRQPQKADLDTLADLAERLEDNRRRAEVALRQANYAVVTGNYPAALAGAQQAVSLAQHDQ